MDHILLLTISSSVVSIIGFFVSIFKDFKWRTSLLLVVSAITFICMSIYIQKLETRIERTENIQRAALKLVDEKNTRFTSEGFVQAGLSFLETNKDLYPDTYIRAVEIEHRMHESESIYAKSDAASEMSGIIYGIAILNEK